MYACLTLRPVPNLIYLTQRNCSRFYHFDIQLVSFFHCIYIMYFYWVNKLSFASLCTSYPCFWRQVWHLLKFKIPCISGLSDIRSILLMSTRLKDHIFRLVRAFLVLKNVKQAKVNDIGRCMTSQLLSYTLLVQGFSCQNTRLHIRF